ncbi:inositol transport system sugar-binding protein [Gracilibacillus boraciitolerans JCM 21714]|uniref:Inositol transport system sugar-binding protein n=1 Tax=Gracilibacillus boraciitolerans JCM 21714 TaxID=1298598 RepID=W4VPA4_9BACI|nr:inositol transport system sugar-binding protein [Gracilibacillus boraciitolerans JCM 21714]
MKKMNKYLLLSIVVLFALFLMTACNDESESTGGEIDTQENNMGEVSIEGPIKINESIPSDTEIISKGPNGGEKAVSAHSIELTEEEVAKIREGNYTAAIAMHYAGNDWSRAQINGLEDTFKKMGIEILTVTDGQFSAEKQMSDIETILGMDPDILVSIPVDAVSSAAAYRKAVDQGVKIVFMDNVAEGFTPSEDYVSVVSADNYGNGGVEAAHLMAEQLGGKGKIGVIYHDADFFVTGQRVEAFEATIENEYPEIEIVERGGIADASEGESVANSMITRTPPDLDGMFVVWDVPAEGALSAIRTAGLDDVVVTTIDLGTPVALDMAKGQHVKGWELNYHMHKVLPKQSLLVIRY